MEGNNNVTYTPVEPFNTPVRKYVRVHVQPKWPKTQYVEVFETHPSVEVTTRVAPVQALVQPMEVLLEFGNFTYIIRNVREVREVYDFVQRKLKAQAAAEKQQRARKIGDLFMSKRLPTFTLHFQGRLLRNDKIPLIDYNVYDGARLTAQVYFLHGGGANTIQLPTYSHILECEKMVLEEVMKVQSSDDTDFNVSITDVMGGLRTMFSQSGQGPYFVKLVEDVLLLVRGLVTAKSKVDYTITLVTFVKLRMDGPLFSSRILNLLTNKLQSLFRSFEVQNVEETFASLRDYLTYYDKVKESPLFAKLYKFMMYALSLSLFEKLGVTFDTLRYSKLESEAIKRQFHMGPDFIHTVLDTLLFICERGYQCMVTGSLDPIYHCGSSYQKWFDDAMALKRTANKLSFPEAHGVDRHKYLADLRDHIEKGDAIYKHAIRLTTYDKKCVGGVLSDLKLLLDNEITKREAQKERDAPFSVLLYGGSSIGKSSLTAMLFTHYGKVFGLQTGSEYKYTRNANDEFWSGFNSSQWCVQLDDIAFMHPNKASEGDKSVMEMLQVVNNVPFVPAQADLADKGRTPLRAKLVIATSNCENLNARHYFQTPLAVQRRLPFIIEARVKEEFAREDAVRMLDNDKTSNIEGEYCNYWNFYIKKVIPDPNDHTGRTATTRQIEFFDDVNDFLEWFSLTAKHHEKVQKIVKSSGEIMSNISVCPTCFRAQKACRCVDVQSTDALDNTSASYSNSAPPTWWETIKYYTVIGLLVFLNSDLFTEVMRRVFKTAMFQKWLEVQIVAEPHRMRDLRTHFYKMGDRVNRAIGNYQMAVSLISVVTQAYLAYKSTQWIISTLSGPSNFEAQGASQSKSDEEETDEGDLCEEETPFLSRSIGSSPTPTNNERVNVWHKDDFELTSFDVPTATVGLSNLPHAQVCDMVGKNVVFLSSMSAMRTKPRTIRATCLGGHVYVCNNHGLPQEGDLTVTVTSRNNDTGVTPNTTFRVSQKSIYRIIERDVAFLEITAIPVRRNLSTMLPNTKLGGVFKGTYVGLTAEGSQFRLHVDAIKSHIFNIDADDVKVAGQGWLGRATVPTQNGDCGSMLVADTPRGPILMGMHFVGGVGNTQVGLMPLLYSDYEAAIAKFGRPVVQSSVPLLNAPTTNHVVGDLHKKSVFRFIEEGSANVYGSLQGFRAAPKSRVVPTVISDAVEKRGYEVKHGKPVMTGWAPWRIAALEMVKPVAGMDTAILSACVDGYTNDILTKLSPEDLAEIMVYDDNTTLNGFPGVQYVDKMNRNTSAGFPWRKSKKYFLSPMEGSSTWPEGVVADPEIMERVQIIIDNYKRGERFMPVFTGHLKDEATKFSKIEAKKTRVFTGAPFDWSFVVRKYCLAFVRVLQRNKFIFEAAPGTNAQSLEWQEIRNHLTKFGETTMVAGDYAAFDKSMPPCMILAAFDVIRRVCAAAGFSTEEQQILQCIAEDTAYPLVDFNGDLVEFFGSNPSGHPLTVIVNCIANSLYMRYCWVVLSGDSSCLEFQNYVALMTYGDDNVLGVSPKAPFFNHTSIQQVLASVGVKYTMADKEAESVPYITIAEVSFLKREWRWDTDVGAYLAPLEEASIGKSLTRVVASKTVPAEQQAVDVLSAACREYFFHGKSIFLEKRNMLMEIATECGLTPYLEDSTFPTWDELYQCFWNNSKHVKNV